MTEESRSVQRRKAVQREGVTLDEANEVLRRWVRHDRAEIVEAAVVFRDELTRLLAALEKIEAYPPTGTARELFQRAADIARAALAQAKGDADG